MTEFYLKVKNVMAMDMMLIMRWIWWGDEAPMSLNNMDQSLNPFLTYSQ